MNIDTTLGTPLLIGISVVLLISLGLVVRETIAHTGRKAASLILVLRTLAVLAILILLLKPYFLESVPDRDSFSIALLADVSGSMQTIDSPQTLSRGAIMNSLLDAQSADSMLATLTDRYSFKLKTFAEEVQPLTASYKQLQRQNKATAMGDALLDVINTKELENKPLAAVVLLTDGNSNTGADIQSAIDRFRREGIPVTAIGIGDLVEEAGMSVDFEEKKVKTLMGAKTTLNVRVSNTYPSKKMVNLVLRHRKNIVDTIKTELPGQQQTLLAFSVTPDYVGIEPYTVAIENAEAPSSAQKSDQDQTDSNVDTVLVYSERSDSRRVLYVSDELSADYRFIKQSLVDEEVIEFNSLIRLTADKFHHQGENLTGSYPEQADFWQKYDAILMNSNVLHKLSPAVLQGLHDFVNKRGGGLLLFGPLAIAQTEEESPLQLLEGLLPGKNTELLSLKSPQTALIQWSLFEAPIQKYAPSLSAGTQVQILTDNNIAVRTPVWSKQENTGDTLPILQVQSYGAGKSAYWSVPDSWRWSLAGSSSHEVFQKFWQHLVYWLGSGALERVSFPEDRYFFVIEEPVGLKVDVTTADFSPATDALVEAVITSAQGQRHVPLLPDPKIAGRYTANYTSATDGIQEVNYQALLGNGEVLQRQTLMVFSYSQAENIENSFKPEVLKELAYATQGNYYHYSDIVEDPGNLDVATIEQLPEIQVRRYITDNIFYLLGVILLLGCEWILRRRWGLH